MSFSELQMNELQKWKSDRKISVRMDLEGNGCDHFPATVCCPGIIYRVDFDFCYNNDFNSNY